MKVSVKKSFERDVEKITDKKLAKQISTIINEMETCKKLSELNNLKKMHSKGSYYRIRIGNYRLGLKVESENLILLRFMHRKDIYKYFP
ncbi:MAG: type II toxin-antitoxin system RelE family toxin [Ginsengibacter sp.]|jgi:mRNA interferase RelE/StbE